MVFKQSSNRDVINFVNFDCFGRSFANQGFAAIIIWICSWFERKQLNDYLHSQSSYLFSWFCVLSLNSLYIDRITFGPAKTFKSWWRRQQQTAMLWHDSGDQEMRSTSVLARNLDSPVGTARVFAETKVTPKIRSMSLFLKKKTRISHRSTIL